MATKRPERCGEYLYERPDNVVTAICTHAKVPRDPGVDGATG